MLLKARAEGDTRVCAVVATVVSSAAVGRMAHIEGFEFYQTATGFKNIGGMGLQLKQQVQFLDIISDLFCLVCLRVYYNLCRTSTLIHHQGKRVLLCYEEAIGFSCGEDCFDKVSGLIIGPSYVVLTSSKLSHVAISDQLVSLQDGVSTAAVFGELAHWVYCGGKTLQQVGE
jgi:hypothetical protein